MLRLALIAGAVAAVLAAFGGTYYAGHRAGTASADARIAEAIAEAQARHAVEIAAILDDANQRIAEAEAEINALQQDVDAYEQEIATRPDVCTLDPGDADRLRNIK